MLFFVSQSILVGALYFMNYQKEVQVLDASIFSQMRVCSYELKCEGLELDFVQKDSYELYKLYKDKENLSAYFSIANSTKNSLKIYLKKEIYEQKIQELEKKLLSSFLIVLFFVAGLSILFSLYTLSPFRNALRVTEEFIKDILHDFNTPISTLRLNAAMLKDEIGENTKIQRIQNSVQNILNLQSNLRAYLNFSVTQKEIIELEELLQERVALLSSIYKEIEFSIEVPKVQLSTNRDALTRILDNILTNAAKYNKKNGKVRIVFKEDFLKIEDTGKGIVNPKRVFDRFYKEQERGIGIGLHIVKKLCDELDVDVSVQSEIDKGTTFTLGLKKIK